MQYGDKDDTCMVGQAEYPAQGNCKSVIEAPIMASDVHQEDVSSHEVGSPCRRRGGLRSRALAPSTSDTEPRYFHSAVKK